MKARLLSAVCLAFCLTSCFGSFQKIRVEFETRSTLLEGQKLEEDQLVLREGQSIAIALVVFRGGKKKPWGAAQTSRNSSVADIYETTEKNVYVVTGHRPGKAELEFRIHDRRWYTVRKEFLQVEVLKRRDFTPSQGSGGVGGAAGSGNTDGTSGAGGRQNP